MDKKDYACMDLKVIILKVLSQNPMHGYKLACEVEKIFEKKPSNGALNPLFESLESNELIISMDSVESGKYKKIYSITNKGKEELEKISLKILQFMQ